MIDLRPAPYPADTRAKGWRFELDHERIAQSSTWALAGSEGRPWLLMLWMTAWQQAPCGSLPDDEEVIAALIGCPPKSWAKLRKALLRGWQKAEDGRLYHATITQRVMEMVEQRTKTAKRVADYKAKLRGQRGGNALPTSESHDKNDTGTGTGTGLREREDTHTVFDDRVRADPADPPDASPTPAGAICRALRSAGIANTNPGHPLLGALLEAGATEAEFLGAAPDAKDKRDPFAYLLGVVKGQREDAAKAASGLHKGPIPQAPPAETAYARKMREQYEVIAPSIAARKPGSPTPITFDMEPASAAQRLTE